jgi:Uma2 family endonuclease
MLTMTEIIEVVERYELPAIPTLDLPEEDGVPLETNWHRAQINLLIDVVTWRWRERRDFFVGGNMFIYYSVRQARNRDYKGPDFFLVRDVDGTTPRGKWVVWEEDGRFPDAIIELMSPSTLREDLGPKKALYERTFHTPDYFCYDPDADRLYGWRLLDRAYVPLEPSAEGRLWSAELDAWIGRWSGDYLGQTAVWLRLFDPQGQLLLTQGEAGLLRAAELEAENERLREELRLLKDSS